MVACGTGGGAGAGGKNDDFPPSIDDCMGGCKSNVPAGCTNDEYTAALACLDPAIITDCNMPGFKVCLAKVDCVSSAVGGSGGGN